MNNNSGNIFDDRNCLSEKKLVDYVQGNLNSAEHHRIEKHLVDCELCSEAAEGILLMENPQDLYILSDEINNTISSYPQDKKEAKIKVMFPWQMAAAFALLFLSAITLWVFLPNRDSQQLFTQEYKPYPVKEKTAKEIVVPQPIQPSASLIKNEKAKVVNEKFKAASDRSVAVKKSISPATESDNNAKPLNNISADQTPLSKEKIQVEPSTANSETFAPAMSRMAAPESKTSNLINNNYQSGLQNYKEAKYLQAISFFSADSLHAESVFYCGLSYLSLSKPVQAIKLFNEFRLKGQNDLTEASFWYEALANLKLNNKKSAQKCLITVINFNGEYKLKAEQLIQKI